MRQDADAIRTCSRLGHAAEPERVDRNEVTGVVSDEGGALPRYREENEGPGVYGRGGHGVLWSVVAQLAIATVR